MKIKAFIVAYNEAEIIRFTIRHYQKMGAEVYLFDNYSTDDTAAIAGGMGCHVREFGERGIFDDRLNLEIKNNAWKDHRDADYVIMCDADEILYHIHPNADLPFYKSVGYNMYSENMPLNSWDEIKLGYPATKYNKILMFSPKLVKEINYTYGCHWAKPEYRWDKKSIAVTPSLRHMRYIGGVDRMIERYNCCAERLSGFNRENQFGVQYFKNDFEIKGDWEAVKNKVRIIR